MLSPSAMLPGLLGAENGTREPEMASDESGIVLSGRPGQWLVHRSAARFAKTSCFVYDL